MGRWKEEMGFEDGGALLLDLASLTVCVRCNAQPRSTEAREGVSSLLLTLK